MTYVSSYSNVSLDSNVSSNRNSMNGIEEIAEVLTRIRAKALMRGFLDSILTERELKEVAGRWEIVKLLDQGVSQRQVARQLGMSLCKITRGSRELKKENSPLKRVIKEYL